MINALGTKIDTNLHRKTPQKYIYKTGREKLTFPCDGDLVLIVFSTEEKKRTFEYIPNPSRKEDA